MIKINAKKYPVRFILVIVTTIFWLLIWSKILVKETDGWFSSCYNCWGDWSAHLTYTTSFAYGNNWPPQLPIFKDHKFTYPFAMDLISAGLVKLGFDLPGALVIPGFVLSIILTGLIYYLAKALTGNRLTAVFSVILFFGNAGWDKDSRWLNFITSQLIPQRGILLGLSLSIVIYLLLWKKKPLLAGVIAGLLPLIHMHSYLMVLAVGFFSGWKFLLPSLLIGLPQIGYFYGWGVGKNFFAFDPFWVKQWLKLWPMLGLLLLGWLKSPPKLKKFLLPFWLVFITVSCFRFQPFAWDNSKFLIHWYLLTVISFAAILSRVKFIGALLVLILINPSFFDITQLLQYDKNKYRFFSNEQLVLAENIRANTPPQAIFLTAFNHSHPLPALTGRQIVMGYPGWLWTYGIDYLPRQADVDEIYTGSIQAQALIDQYQIDYVVIGPDERLTFPRLNAAYFAANFPKVFETGDNQVFKLK